MSESTAVGTGEKRCKKCGITKEINEFCRDRSKKDGRNVICRACAKIEYDETKRRYAENGYVQVDKKTCTKCRRTLPPSAFTINRRSKDGLNIHCAECHAKRQSKLRYDNLEQYMLDSARQRAKKKGLEFNIDLSDIYIPPFCPLLGMQLKTGYGYHRQRDNSPSLDRLDTSKGYVKGNVWVVSWRANRIKSDATYEELKRMLMVIEQSMEHGLFRHIPSILAA